MSNAVKPVKNREEFLRRYAEESVDKLKFEIGGKTPKAYLGEQCIFDPDRLEKLLVRPKMSKDGFDRGGYWTNEMWEAYLGEECIYRKVKTVENCLNSYGYVKQVWYNKGNTNKNDTNSAYRYNYNLYTISRPGTSTDVYIISDNRQGFHINLPPISDFLRPGAFASQKFHAHTDLEVIRSGGRMIPIPYTDRTGTTTETPLDRRYLIGTVYPQNGHKLYAQVGDWFSHNILTAGANIAGVFGAQWSNKSSWNSWIPVMHNVYDDWTFNIGKSNDPGYRAYYDELRSYSTALGGVIGSASISGTSMGNITINFDDNYISMTDNLFSNLNTHYKLNKLKVRFCDGTGPRLGGGNTYAQGFIPHNANMMFSSSGLTQEQLDEITTNCLWNECRSMRDMFHEFSDSGEVSLSKIKAATIWRPAYGCTPYQDVPENTIRLGYHKGKETDLRYKPWEHVPDGPYKKMIEDFNRMIYDDIYEVNPFFSHAFTRSSIEDVQVILDMEYYTPGGLIDSNMSWSVGFIGMLGGKVYCNVNHTNNIREIRLKNVGNAGYYDFSNFEKLSEASIDYMINHLIDRRNPSAYAYTKADIFFFTNSRDYHSGIQFHESLIKRVSKEKWKEWGEKAKQKGVCICFAFRKLGEEKVTKLSVEKFKDYPTIFDDESVWV